MMGVHKVIRSENVKNIPSSFLVQTLYSRKLVNFSPPVEMACQFINSLAHVSTFSLFNDVSVTDRRPLDHELENSTKAGGNMPFRKKMSNESASRFAKSFRSRADLMMETEEERSRSMYRRTKKEDQTSCINCVCGF